MTRALRILLVGHPCSPKYGSEPGVTWNWAWHLSARHEVWVLAHPEYRHHVEEALRARPNPRLRFVWITPPSRVDPWDPARGERGLRVHYLLWQRLALRAAEELTRQHHFDIAHYVSWNTVSAPPPLWRLPIPFVWGPVGGGQVAPPAFHGYFGSRWPKEVLRSLRIRLLPHLPALRRAVAGSAMVVAGNQDTARLLEAAGSRAVRLLVDAGLPPEYLPPRLPERGAGDALTLLWAGRLEPRKALPLALEALTMVRDLPIRLLVAGGGWLREDWERRANALGLEARVEFLGHVPWERMRELFQVSDVFVFTSLRDSSGWVVLEAMAQGLPVLAIDHQGVPLLVPDGTGVKVPVTNPRETVVALADGIRRLSVDPNFRRRLGTAAFAHARTQTWDLKAARMEEWYEELVQSRHDKLFDDTSSRSAGGVR